MKKILFGIICLLALSFTVSAQQGQGGNRPNFSNPEEMAKRETETLKTELKLTQTQLAPVEAANLAYSKEIAKLFENAGGGGDRTAMREQMTKLEAKRVEAFGKVLTKEQLDAYKKYSETRFQRGPGQGGQGGGNRNN